MKSIVLDNDYELEVSVTRKNTSTGADEAAPALTITGRLSATVGGAAIHADLSKTLAERTSKTGTYYATIGGDALRTHLASVVNQSIYAVYVAGTAILLSIPVAVRAEREI